MKRIIFFTLIGWLGVFTAFGQCAIADAEITNVVVNSSSQVTVSITLAIKAPNTKFFGSLVSTSILYGVQGSGIIHEVVAGSSTVVISGLSPASTYQFTAATNWDCWSIDPITHEITDEEQGVTEAPFAGTRLTYPNPPALATASSPNATSITAAWSLSSGTVNNYLLDVATSNAFTAGTLVLQDHPIGNSATSFNTANKAGLTLTPGTNYYYRLRAANNTGASSYSAVSAAIVTRPAAPAINDPTEKRSTAVVANWTSPGGVVASYKLDFSAASDFSSFVLQDVTVSGTSREVTGLAPGTTYYYRVRAINASGASLNSTFTSALTAPATPLLFDKSNITPTSFDVNWTASATATQYDVFVYTDAAFTTPLPDYNPKTVDAPGSVTTIAGLTASTTYYVKLRARNSAIATNSGSDFISQIVTTAPPGTGSSLSFQSVTAPASLLSTETKNITATVDGASGAVTMKLYHRKNSENAYTIETIPVNAGVYTIAIQDAWLDDFGMEYYLEAKDNSLTKKDTNRKVLRAVSTVNANYTTAGDKLANYQILSIPYQLDKTVVQEVFGKVMGSFDPSKWRMSHFGNNQLVEYEDGLAFQELEQGAGYWFISKNDVTLNFGKGISYGTSLAEPFTFQLTAGWNQIGNPFPFAIKWSDVLASNAGVTGVSDLYQFNQETSAFDQQDELPVFRGGFVYADQAVAITVPVTLPRAGAASGRTASVHRTLTDGWQLPIQARQGESANSLNGIGMATGAREGYDEFDNLVPPAFFTYPTLYTVFTNSPALSRDVVALQPNYEWKYQVAGDRHFPVDFTWSPRDINQVQGNLRLFDEQAGVLLDMKQTFHYTARPGSLLRIYFTTAPLGELPADGLALGVPYPNPFRESLAFPVIAQSSQAVVSLEVLDETGNLIHTQEQRIQGGTGVAQMITWDGYTQSGHAAAAGIYFYRMTIRENGCAQLYRGKISKN